MATCQAFCQVWLAADLAAAGTGQVPGWRLVEADGVKHIAQDFKVKDSDCGEELVKRFTAIIEEQGKKCMG